MKKYVLIFLLLVMSVANLYAQYVPRDGDIDSTFGVNGSVKIVNGATLGVVMFPNDDVVEVGDFNFSTNLTKVTKDGQLGGTFGIAAYTIFNSLFYAPVRALGVDDDKILAAWQNDGSYYNIERCNEDGIPDTVLGNDGVAANLIHYVNVYPFIFSV